MELIYRTGLEVLEKKNSFTSRGIEPRFLGYPAPSLITVISSLFLILISSAYLL